MGNWRGLNLNTRVGYHTKRDLLLRVCFVSLSLKVSLFFVGKELTQSRCASRGISQLMSQTTYVFLDILYLLKLFFLCVQDSGSTTITWWLVFCFSLRLVL